LSIPISYWRAAECQELFERLQNRETIFYISSFTIHSIEVILERDGLHEYLINFLQDIHRIKGLKRFDTDTLEELEAVKLAQSLNLDFDDAIQYYICKTHNLKIVSFDKHFDQTDVERIEPKDILL
jgi:hypothetical protein